MSALSDRPLRAETLALHAGYTPDPTTGSRAVPIYQTTSYVFRDTAHAGRLFALEESGNIYTRIMNPTTDVLEQRLAALEGGVAGLAVASGQAAETLTLLSILRNGDELLSGTGLYGGTYNLFANTLPRFGIETTFVDPRDPAAFKAAIRPETRLLFGETLGNPGLEIMDMQAIADIAHDAGLPLMIDNTFASPALFRPIDHGADIVMHSVTKFIGGHGVAIGGVIVDGGGFDWQKSGKFPTMTEPYAGYHGLNFWEEYGPAAFIMRARNEGLRDFGASMSPQNAFYILQGVETLSVRMARHVENARKVIEFLNGHEAVNWVSYPELPDHPDHEKAKAMLPKGAGAVFSFGINGGREAGRAFIENLQIFSHLANIGDAKSLVIHPASTTHQQMDAASLEAAGIGEDLVRLSVGLEDPADLIDDLKGALRASQKAVKG